MTHVVAITGAGSGLGRALALRYARRGSTVALMGRNVAKLQDTHLEVARLGGRSLVIPCDVDDDASVDRCFKKLLQQTGRVDLLVNNAGLGQAGGLLQTPLQVWRRCLETHLLGAVRACKAVVPSMQVQRSGHLAFVASFAAFANPPEAPAYSASKAALVSLAESLQYELCADNIAVTVVCPAIFRSEIHRAMLTEDETFRTQFERMIARSRTSADDVAAATIAAIDRKRFLCITDRKSRQLYWIKRAFPAAYYSLMQRYIRKRKARLHARRQSVALGQGDLDR